MLNPLAESCVGCGAVLSTRGSKYERAALLSGSPYCTICISTLTFSCEKCARTIILEDFEQGRAMTILGRKYCEDCLESAVERTRKGEVAPTPAVAAPRLPSGAPARKDASS